MAGCSGPAPQARGGSQSPLGKGRGALAPCHRLYFMLAALNELTAKGFFINSTWQPCISLDSPLTTPPPPKKPKKRNFKQKLSGITWVEFDLGEGVFFKIFCQVSLVPPSLGMVCGWDDG